MIRIYKCLCLYILCTFNQHQKQYVSLSLTHLISFHLPAKIFNNCYLSTRVYLPSKPHTLSYSLKAGRYLSKTKALSIWKGTGIYHSPFSPVFTSSLLRLFTYQRFMKENIYNGVPFVFADSWSIINRVVYLFTFLHSFPFSHNLPIVSMLSYLPSLLYSFLSSSRSWLITFNTAIRLSFRLVSDHT